MRALPGSHKLGLLDHDSVADDLNLLNQRGERVKMDVPESEAIDVVLAAGEMSLHHANLVHGSNPNGSDGPRIGFIVRFVTSRTPNRNRVVMRIRGRGDCSHLQVGRAPIAESRAAAVAAWRSGVRQELMLGHG
jgi:ectoine hydroxylase-related dioxygenase (phytanoyl-CoA dioxygenase family)